MSKIKENLNSEFRAISWKEANKYRRYMIGNEVMSDEDSDGKPIRSYVYSIDDTSYRVDGTNTFVLRYTVRLISKNGEVFDWYEVVNGDNITLMRNHANFGVI